MAEPEKPSALQKPVERYLEIAIPVLSFGITVIGIIFWARGYVLDYQYFSVGCIVSSCILAYLAWLRPKKDIVALTTPVYAFIFFLVPSDDVSWIVLQLLYAGSITILLVRLKHRFGRSLPARGAGDDRGPLGEYVDRVNHLLAPISPVIAGDAGAVFIRFAQGDYESVAAFISAIPEEKYAGMTGAGQVRQAFTIIAEQAAQIREGGAAPAAFADFSPNDEQLLFHQGAGSREPERAYAGALDNALLFLYACGMASSNPERIRSLGQIRPFARKLSEQQ